ncbi:hypothetical protein DIPPA_31334 [Diplonema papillatum]|nr:hypothetical protein DIPPA_31334 [Diplonema papillatum]
MAREGRVLGGGEADKPGGERGRAMDNGKRGSGLGGVQAPEVSEALSVNTPVPCANVFATIHPCKGEEPVVKGEHRAFVAREGWVLGGGEADKPGGERGRAMDNGKRGSGLGGLRGVQAPEVSEALSVNTPVPCANVFATIHPCKGEEPVVWTSSSTGAIILRDSNTCEVIAKIDSVNPTCILAVGNKAWVGRDNGMINVYDQTGTFLTVLQNGSDNLPVDVMAHLEDRVWSSATSKDIVEWDANRFCALRILFGPQPGDQVLSIVHNQSLSRFLLFSGSRGFVRVWNADGRWTHSIEGGSKSLVHVQAEAQLWSATDRGIAVFNLAHPTDPLTVMRTLLQGMNVLQLLFLPTESRVWALCEQQGITVFNTTTLAPVQSVRIPDTCLVSQPNAFVSHKKEVTKVWLVSDEGHNVVVYDSTSHVRIDQGKSEDSPSAALENAGIAATAQKEVEHLKKKIRYLQSVGTVFRQRIGILFSEKFRQRDVGAVQPDAADFENMYRQALTDLVSSNPEAAGVLNNPELSTSAIQPPDWPAKNPALETLALENASLQQALNDALSSNAKGGPGGDADMVAKYWKEKLRASHDELSQTKQEVERLSTMLHEIGPQKDIDIKRAHHICQVLKEKNALKEREMSLQEEVEVLKKSLGHAEERYIELKNSLGDYVWNNMQQNTGETGSRQSMSAIDAKIIYDAVDQPSEQMSKEKQYSIVVDQMREDNEKLKQELMEAQRQIMKLEDQQNECHVIVKQNALLKNRIQKLKETMHTQRASLTNNQAEVQGNMEALMNNVNQLQQDLVQKEHVVQELSGEKLKLMQDISRMNTILERYKTKVLNLERETISRTKAEQISDREHRKETQTLCESLDSREGKIQQLQANFVDISEQLQHQVQQVARTNHELDLMSRENMSLKSKLQQLDMLLDERRQFTQVLGEVQGRMEMAIEDLKRAQSTTELASEMANLEARIAGLTTLESQLKQKDDLIAVRDDEIQKLKLRLAMFERNVNNISAVFLQFPHSLEEMELMVIENEEFRKMAGENAEIEERVRLRQLEMQARKQQQQRAGVVSNLQSGVTASLDAATAALLARTGDDSESDDDLPQLPSASQMRRPMITDA